MSLKPSANAPITCTDWGNLANETGFLALGRNRYHCSYIIYTDGTRYYAENGSTGVLQFGGPNNIGVSGTDAQAVIQAALNALPAVGGLIFIKAGNYVIDSTLTITSLRTFEGEGWNSTTLTSTITDGTPVINVTGNRSRLANFFIQGNGAEGDGIQINARNLRFDNIEIYQVGGNGFRSGVTAAAGDNAFFQCEGRDCTGAGFYFDRANYTGLHSCRSAYNTSHGFYFTNVTSPTVGVTIINPLCEGNGADGIRIDGGDNITIVGGFWGTHTGIDIHIRGGDDEVQNVYIANTRHQGTSTHGVYVDECRYIYIFGDSFGGTVQPIQVTANARDVFINSLRGATVAGTETVQVSRTTDLFQIWIGFLQLRTYTDATRPAPGNAGVVIYNANDNGLNIDDGVNWRDTNMAIT